MSDYKPAGWRDLIPRIIAHDAEGLVRFIQHVFGASGEFSRERPTVLIIGDSMIMISAAGVRNPMPAFSYVYVDDADVTFRRAVEAGAKTIEEPSNTPYGDRRGMVEDA